MAELIKILIADELCLKVMSLRNLEKINKSRFDTR